MMAFLPFRERSNYGLRLNLHYKNNMLFTLHCNFSSLCLLLICLHEAVNTAYNTVPTTADYFSCSLIISLEHLSEEHLSSIFHSLAHVCFLQQYKTYRRIPTHHNSILVIAPLLYDAPMRKSSLNFSFTMQG